MTNLQIKLLFLNAGFVLVIAIIILTLFFSYPSFIDIVVMGVISIIGEYIKYKITGVRGWIFKE